MRKIVQTVYYYMIFQTHRPPPRGWPIDIQILINLIDFH